MVLRIWETARKSRAEPGRESWSGILRGCHTFVKGQGTSQDLIVAFGSRPTRELRAMADASTALLASALLSSLTVVLEVGGMGPVTHQETDQ